VSTPRRWLAALGAALAAAGALLAGGGGPAADEAPMPAVRRLLLPPERVPREMERLRQGALRQLPREEFEGLVRRAAAADAARRDPPRLVEARYRGALADTALAGTGQWRVAHAGPGPGLLPLDPLNVALRQPRFENRDALIADFDGRTSALLVDSPGDHSVAVGWSARGEERPEGLHFDLRVPACPVALLELDLPADRVAAAGGGVLLSGPHPAEAADRRLWRVGFGGRPGAELWIRPGAPPPGQPPGPVFARQQTAQTLGPGGVDAVFRFELDVQRPAGAELVFEHDPALRPCEVTHPDLESWAPLPPAGPGAPARLAARLHGPLREGPAEVQVRCLAPLPAGAAAWTSPWMRLAGAVPRGETLALRWHPDLELEDFYAGDFRTAPGGAGPDEPAGFRRLALAGGGTGPGESGPRRPSARLRPRAAEFRARQAGWWQLAPGPETWTVQVTYDVEEGRLFQLPVLLPPGWEVDRVDLSPAGLLQGSAVRPASPEEVAAAGPGTPAGGGWSVLVVDLQRPAGPEGGRAGGEPAGLGALFGRARPRPPVLTVRLHPRQPGPVAGRDLEIPDAVPLGARFREGVLALGLDPQVYQADVRTSAPEAEVDEDGPWGKQAPDRAFAYRGGPLRGSVRLAPRAPQLRARCSSEVFLASGHARVGTRVVLEAEVGSVQEVELALSAAGGPERPGTRPAWEWRAERGGSLVRRAERAYPAEAAAGLAALAADHPLGAAALAVSAPRGPRWRLTLDRPLRVRDPLVLHATRALEPAGGRWEVPLPSVPGAARMEGEVTLHLAGADLVEVESAGLREALPSPAAAPRARRASTAGPAP
jgi:hypothetical protein